MTVFSLALWLLQLLRLMHVRLLGMIMRLPGVHVTVSLRTVPAQ